MNLFFPKQANNSITFDRKILIVFTLITLMTLIRSLIHVFAFDGGANSIATIITFSGTPDPDLVIYFVFSLWGLSQLLMGLFYIIVIWRYKNLIPLMFIFIFIEYAMRIVIGRWLKPLSDVYFTGTAPGEIGNIFFVVVVPLILIWIILSQSKKGS
ncbi:MAG: hypothetical protein FD133_1548 [Erysipelotrichaceae bacterium]|nr:MAG: hypothetical protein FD179_1703 [Erysipelotrichaceae bacterium]TXT17076.1 MAG: hypothetical protein FD133_1548 [Erysipelotrichaceae bacterium]